MLYSLLTQFGKHVRSQPSKVQGMPLRFLKCPKFERFLFSKSQSKHEKNTPIKSKTKNEKIELLQQWYF
jgi:hypothetical protein